MITALLIFGLMFTACGLVGLAITVQNYRRCIASQSWPFVNGTIRESHVEHDLDNDPMPTVSFEYTVEGIEHVGTKVDFEDRDYDLRSTDEVLAAYPVGARVRVYYDSSDHQTSVLLPGIPSGKRMVFTSAFLLANLVLGTALIYFAFCP